MKKYILGLFVIGFIVAPWLSFGQATDDIDPNPQASDCVSIVNNLRYKDRDINKNGEVSTLQDFLQSKSYLNNEPTGYFGLLTFKAVKDFQKANNINPTGYVGTITRAKIKTLTCDEGTIIPSEQKFTGYLTVQGPTTTMWGTHTLTTEELVKCFVGPCSQNSRSKIYPVGANSNSVLSDLKRYENNQVTIVGQLKWYDLEGGFWGITANKVIPINSISNNPVISGVSGPQTLNVNQTGKWKVKASNPNGENLSYSVKWGDEPVLVCIPGYPCSANARALAPQQSATFTHSYGQAGIYTPTFTVTSDGHGALSATTSLSVKVGNVASDSSITVLSPNGGETLEKGNNQTIKWEDNMAFGCPVGVPCAYRVKFYDINLISYYPSCPSGSKCSKMPYLAPFTIAKDVAGYSYDWQVANATSTGANDIDVPNGKYTIQICRTGTDICDSSDKPFTIQ